jgi:bifunctional non-homologous end joining protein LigD
MAGSAEVAGVEISKPDKELFPKDGITKLDVARYYADVAEVMVPHLADHPINMQRFPDGVGGIGFYEKKVPAHFPAWVSRVRVRTSDGAQDQVVISDVRSLVYLADQACITPHAWLSRTSALDQPDQIVFDLDPSVDDLRQVRRATRMTGEVLDELGLTTYLKTTGSRGYHVVVPLRPHADYDGARRFARGVAELLATRSPDLLTVEQRKAKRGPRVFVDVMRNAYGQTAVPPYAVRARDGAPVSTPIGWDELSSVQPTRFTVANLARRLSRGGDPWRNLRRHAQGLRKAEEKLRRLAG